MPLTREDRVRNGRLGAYQRLAKESDWSKVTEAARAAGPASLDWHAAKIDPDNQLPPEQRRKQAEAARRAFYLKMAARSAAARKAKAGDTPEAA